MDDWGAVEEYWLIGALCYILITTPYVVLRKQQGVTLNTVVGSFGTLSGLIWVTSAKLKLKIVLDQVHYTFIFTIRKS